MRSAELRYSADLLLKRKIDTRRKRLRCASDTTIPHSEIHIPHFLHHEPIYQRINERLPLIGR